MNSQEALALAIEQVNTMSTNARGYQDGITLPQKIDAVERLAAFLMGEGTADAVGGDPDLVVHFVNHWPNDEVLFRCVRCGAITEDEDPHREWHRGLGR